MRPSKDAEFLRDVAVYTQTLAMPSLTAQILIGLQQSGSFITSVKNPSSRGPANASLPKAAEFPQELLDEFHGRSWMPLQPKCLDYVNAQILLIGHQDHALEKAAGQEQEGGDQGKDKPIEELEKLENEDHIRIEHLKGLCFSPNFRRMKLTS